MEQEFNTIHFYQKKVARIVYYLALFGVIAVIMSSVKALARNEYIQTPRIWFAITIGIGLIEGSILLIIRKKMFVSEETIIKYFVVLQWVNAGISITNYALTINLMPTEVVWASCVFYLLLITLFQNFKCTGISTLSMAIIAIVYMKMHPVEAMAMIDVSVASNSRMQILVMEIMGVMLVSYFSGYVLANVGQDIMNKNTQKLKDIITKVTGLMKKLEDASSNLVCISEEENASMQEIASVTTSIVGDSNNVLEKSNQSKEKVLMLKGKVSNIIDQMQETKKISDDIVTVSGENQEALSNVLKISETIDESTNNTLKVTKELQGKVDEIGGLLKLIEDIAEETNLLALNASIEAARAGEEGRGFAVVAEQVKRLSENTSNSLKNVNEVIQGFREDTNRVEMLMSNNVKEIEQQSRMTYDTVQAINSTMDRLKQSAEQVEHVKELTNDQNNYTEEIVMISDEVTVCINEQVERVECISELINQNKSAIEQIVVQIEELNSIVGDIQKALE